tara:strand:- start:817 stop:1581 length:765 start_codon:yes stop_codon:yes gene_type:complete
VITKVSTLFNINLLGTVYAAKGIGLSNDGDKNGENNFLQNILPEYIKSASPICMDVGGNTGYYSTEVIKHFPNANIHIFEPNVNTFKVLQKNFAENTQVNLNNLALGNQEETIDIYTYADQNTSGHTSAYSGVFTDMHKKENILKLNATQTTLDNYCNKNNISKIDFLKIDVEGHEHKVLQGAAMLIKSNSIKVIQFEFNEMNVVSRVFLKDFYEVLPNFSFYRLLPSKLLPLGKYDPINEVFKIQNIVAISLT